MCERLLKLGGMKRSSLTLLALACPLVALADSITIPASTSATIFNGFANLGAWPGTMIIGKLNNGTPCRGLLLFDVSEIPSDATISSVTLSVTVLKSTSTDTHSLHRLTTSWNGGATWFNSGTTAWIGGAFAATADSSATFGFSGVATLPSSAAMVQTVQAWVAGTQANNGWLLKLSNESVGRDARRVAGADYGDPSEVPMLTVNYTAPPPPPPPPPSGFAIYNLRASGSLFQFDFQASETNSYTVEYVSTLGGTWHTLTNISVPSASTATVTDFKTNAMRFYRVSATPIGF